MKIQTLNKIEKQEPLMMTFGRIRSIVYGSTNERLVALVEKLNKDLGRAKIKEDYFNNK